MEEEENYLAQDVNLHGAVQQGIAMANQNNISNYQMEEAEQNLAESQLDVNETLEKIRHMLMQDTLKPNEEKNGKLEWTPLKDERKRVLTEEGVDKIMQVVSSYINKETLLSNFDEATIKRRMLSFCLAFSGLIFMKYEIFFKAPTLNECKEILVERINNKVEKRKIALELQGKDYDEKEIKEKIVNELMERFEYELTKIKEERTKLNLREFEMMFVQIEHLIESIHNRAWKGEERGSLRRHFNISEVIGSSQQNNLPKKRSGGWFGLG